MHKLHRSCCVAVLNELARFGALRAEALDGLAVPKIPRSRARPLPLSTALALIDAAERPLRTWLALALYAGLRRAEIAELCGADVDVDGRTLHVVGKGSVARLVPISTALHDELGEVVDRGGRLWEISPNTLGQQVCRHMRRHGVPWGGAHRLRATCATAMVEAGADVQLVAEVLGHCDLGAFSSYVTPSLRRMRAAVEMVAALPAVA